MEQIVPIGMLRAQATCLIQQQLHAGLHTAVILFFTDTAKQTAMILNILHATFLSRLIQAHKIEDRESKTVEVKIGTPPRIKTLPSPVQHLDM